ncbi:DNA topoisomerase 3 [Bacillus wiedmannii]|uniref:type IA DNA topoisomerase n=1 Tax=Bacillus wiedmannii TaxID=1890302 RepID=UPI0027305B76|nr:type IA DNA topoisomerase [Bacillus wiedmannii]MDP1459678.1 DNA topoisomerase 3 [Bacillus wiedmannii]
MIAILCEKADQGRTYGACYEHEDKNTHIEIYPCETFPEGAVIVWASGHLCELKSPEMYHEAWAKWKLETLPMIPERFEHKVVEKKASYFNVAKEKLKSADEIIIATDSGDEGELIARLIIKMAGVNKKPMKRFWCSSMAQDAIREAFENLRDAKETESYFYAAQARSYSDWLVGMNTSRAYSILFRDKFGLKQTFSSGRVQTPVLYLINQREEEIQNFRPRTFYQIVGWFVADGIKYGGLLLQNEDTKILDYLKAKALFEECKPIKQANIQSIESEEKKKNPPKLHSLSTLQAKLNRKYKFSPEKVLELAQSLYLKGVISYPRTSSQYLTEAEAFELPEVLSNLEELEPYAELLRNRSKDYIEDDKKYTNDEKVEDHYALIPTKNVPDLASLSEQERKVYDEIVRSVIAVHYDVHVFTETTILTNLGTHTFIAQGRQVLDEGWQVVWKNPNSKEKEEDQKVQKLPIVQKGQSIDVEKVSFQKGKTKPPTVYTEGQLITLMKTAGKFVEDPEVDTDFNGVGTEATRAGIIKTLKDREYILIRDNKVSVTEKGKMLIEAVRGTHLASVEMTAKWEMLLSKIRNSKGKSAAMSHAFVEKVKEMTTFLVEKAVNESDTWNVEKLAEEVKDNAIHAIGKCPICKKNVVEREKLYGCSGYKKDDPNSCKFTLPKEFLGKKISVANAQKLLEKKKSNLIKGFISKNEKEFDAYLKLVNGGKLELEFPQKKPKSSKKVGSKSK